MTPEDPFSHIAMSYKDFLESSSADPLCEWVDGEQLFAAPICADADRLQVFLAALLTGFVKSTSIGDVLTDALMCLPGIPSARRPALCVLRREHVERLTSNRIDGPADLVIDLRCSNNRTRDAVKRLLEFGTAGVPEYWIIDPERKEAVFLVLNENGHYADVPPDSDGVYHSAVAPGLWIRVDWLFRDPLPPLMDVLREWKMVP